LEMKTTKGMIATGRPSYTLSPIVGGKKGKELMTKKGRHKADD